MCRRNKLIVLFIIGLVVSVAPVVFAQMPETESVQDKAFKGKRDAQMQALYDQLNLTADQKKQLEDNKAKNHEQMKTLFQGIREKRNMLRDELQQDTLNMEIITQLNNELKALQAQMLDHRLQGILEVRKILTTEQFKQFMSLMEERRGRFKERWGKGSDSE